MGNRGVIHNTNKEIVSTFRHKTWITCLLEFKGRHRSVMSPGRWTELFFLDEATAFAAGHRPCFECRREDAKRFKECWIKGNPQYGFTASTSISDFDEVIHRERINGENQKVLHQSLSSDIPDGAFVILNECPYLVHKKKFYRWTPFGYDKTVEISSGFPISVLTPKSILNAFRAGYIPQTALGNR
jgi:hypothetical protein